MLLTKVLVLCNYAGEMLPWPRAGSAGWQRAGHPEHGNAGHGLLLHQVPCLCGIFLLVAWEESDLRGQLSVVSRNCPHTLRTAVPSPQSRIRHPKGRYNNPAAE